MKKMVGFFLALVLSLMVMLICAQAAPEDMEGQILPDFSVETINGDSFFLSDSLKNHDLVLINFWATWCGPCCMEFPNLEAAWEQYADRVDVIALSVEESDSFDVLRQFSEEYGLNFHIGRDETKLFEQMEGTAIPTTLIVDKEMRVVAVEIGSKSSVEAFTSLFDRLLAAVPASNRTEDPCVLRFRDVNGNPIPGVTVAFCNGEYSPVDTDINGYVSFGGSPNEYHVHLLEVPAGYVKPWEELKVSGDTFDLTVTLYHE